MADLNNLLGELEDAEQDAEEQRPLSPSLRGEEEEDDDVNANDDEPPPYDDEDYEQQATESASAAAAQLPPALAEAERLRHRHISAAGPSVRGYDGSQEEPLGGGAYPEGNRNDAAEARPDGAGADAETDAEYEALKSLWVQEMLCPELLPNDGETVGLHLELLRGREDTVEELQEQAAAASEEEEPGGSALLSSLAAGIYKMEADRVRFLLADLARTRLAKIENHALHSRDLIDRMSDEEVAYLKSYGGLVERHLSRTVLNQMPKEAWRKLNEPDMIDRPDLDAYVFCRVLETVEVDSSVGDKKRKTAASSEYDDDDDGDDDDDDEESNLGDSVQEHVSGSFLIARYAAIRGHVLEGKIELLV